MAEQYSDEISLTIELPTWHRTGADYFVGQAEKTMLLAIRGAQQIIKKQESCVTPNDLSIR